MKENRRHREADQGRSDGDLTLASEHIKKGAVWLAGILAIGGIYFLLIVPSYYLYNYFVEVHNPLRHEYLEGSALGVLMSSWFWLPATILVVYAGSMVPKWLFGLSLFPIIVIGTMLIFSSGYVFVQFIIEKFVI